MRKPPKLTSELAYVFVALGFYTGIEAIAGRQAALWFAAGFIVAALIAFWEAGRATARGDQSQPSSSSERN